MCRTLLHTVIARSPSASSGQAERHGNLRIISIPGVLNNRGGPIPITSFSLQMKKNQFRRLSSTVVILSHIVAKESLLLGFRWN